MISITCPLVVWCLEMVREFKKAPGGLDHLLVAIDKFTKWIKVWPIINLKLEWAAESI